MLKVAIYGKGGIGKSTITSNLAAAFAAMGKRVIQIGCDPKADSTINLLGGEPLRPVMNYMREEDEEPEELSDIAKEGYGGVLCIETGGPTPGLGCAGRGIIATFQLLEDLQLFETYKPDVVLYDVLGDVVCGGFAAPIREGYAEKVLIVTSGEKMALYAANNISSAVRNFEDRSYARVFGIVLNHRNVENETEKVQEFSEKSGIPIVGEIPRSDEIIRYEDQGMTVIEGDKDSAISKRFFDLAEMLLKAEEEGLFPSRKVFTTKQIEKTLPDFVFLGTASDNEILVFELKGPDIVADFKEYEQLHSYMMYLQSRYHDSDVKGVLIAREFAKGIEKQKAETVIFKSWEQILLESRKDHMVLLSGLLAGTDADPNDSRVKQICELGGQEVTDFLEHMAEKDDGLKDLVQKLQVSKKIS